MALASSIPPTSDADDLQPLVRERLAAVLVELDDVRRQLAVLNRRRLRLEAAVRNLDGSLSDRRGLADAVVARSMPRRLGGTSS